MIAAPDAGSRADPDSGATAVAISVSNGLFPSSDYSFNCSLSHFQLGDSLSTNKAQDSMHGQMPAAGPSATTGAGAGTVPKAQPRQFNGGAASFFGTQILGVLITICTLGICYPFAVVLIERRRAENTYLHGRQLRLVGTGWGIFGLWTKWLLLSIITLGVYTFWVCPRLQREQAENVSGGQFHAWKNLNGTVRSKMRQKIAATGLVVGMSVSLVGCFANTNNETSAAPINAPTFIRQVIGSGEMITTNTGSYERILAAEDSTLYKYNEGKGNPDYMQAAGWTEEDGLASQKVVTNYMVQEFIDSSALETGDTGLQEWQKNSAPKYYTREVIEMLESTPDSSAVLGNFAGETSLPKFINDGTPRQKNVEIAYDGLIPHSDEAGNKGIKYTLHYKIDYRVDDASAVEFAAALGGTAKDSLKDGTGENIYRAEGDAQIIVGKDANKEWKILGFGAYTTYDSTDFATK
jgi:hypothetical protein